MNLSLTAQFGTIASFMVILMAWAWRLQVRRKDAGIVDAFWAGSFAPIALFLGLTTEGDPVRQAIVVGLVSLWSLRLCWYISADRLTGKKKEDGRYARLRDEKGASFHRWLFLFNQAQGILVLILVLPLRIVLGHSGELGAGDAVGAALILISVVGESIADRQLARFRADPGNRGKVCATGLWRVSRHPNYFFEWLHWLAYPMFAVGAPLGFLAWLAPSLMLLLILKVTGIPPTEEQALSSRGDAYREYQRTTSSFFPWFPTRVTPSDSPVPKEQDA